MTNISLLLGLKNGKSRYVHLWSLRLRNRVLISSVVLKEDSTNVSCDSVCRSTFNLLFSQYQDHCSKVNMGNGNPVAEALDNEEYLFFQARLSRFLASIIMSRTRVYQASEGVVVNESERRAAVDALVQCFRGSQDKQLSDTYL